MIRTSSLTKRYGKQTVVDSIDLDVRPGDRFGFLDIVDRIARRERHDNVPRTITGKRAHPRQAHRSALGDAVQLRGQQRRISGDHDDDRPLVLARCAAVAALLAMRCLVRRCDPGLEATQPFLRQFLADHPDFAMHLTRKLIRMVRRVTEQLRSVALQDVYGRMVRVLNDLSEPAGQERVLRQKLTQQDIADRVGSSREMVNRVMKDLTTGGYVVSREGRHAEQVLVTLTQRVVADIGENGESRPMVFRGGCSLILTFGEMNTVEYVVRKNVRSYRRLQYQTKYLRGEGEGGAPSSSLYAGDARSAKLNFNLLHRHSDV